MKKNRTMKLAAILLVLTLITSCFVGGTFARYISSANSQDTARVANWGFEPETMDLSDLFRNHYDGGEDVSVHANAEKETNEDGIEIDVWDDVIAPGTTGSASFIFAYDDTNGAAPEVAYTFTVEVAENCHDLIKNNKNIVWSLDGSPAPVVYNEDDEILYEEGTWDALIAAIKALSGEADGSADYGPGSLPPAFSANDDPHTISWAWVISSEEHTYTIGEGEDAVTYSQDEYDTMMGNEDVLGECSIEITITATQLDTYSAP